ncbi:hypothetical protein COU17_02355 [Candidatus Kaiserbacteria bacterium CG10_big_fil_rev_8_21_14_0_10_49_17]|uniref:Cation-transporting P-type ATPase N-terminal domain-containing protein n=1 Tax=Candidatus Kaiserbacteria bacterium CG10_big_fil_rev_8_21_14_0_10_49_17 TaxID=1974609 RepID=A0A2M6WE96_9BACT|nr:MAG: hypothetical protein COU17_02355 [Candidatus Kaiserbacteria bacterium CG10_big_fil_rev_8_21_14_0_10_49_17]
MPNNPHATSEAIDVARAFDTDIHTGLSVAEVKERRAQYGANELTEEKRATVLTQIIEQLKSPLVFILLIAGIATVFLGEYLDSIVITIVLLINIVIGTVQEGRASKAFERLTASQEHFATVIRDGKKSVVPSNTLVPGDIIEITAGGTVPADIRILKEKDLTINEAALTGEWIAVSKSHTPVSADTPLAEQHSMAWMGTLVATGSGTGVVVATGAETQVGVIAKRLGTVKEQKTPLQKNVAQIARFMLYVISISVVGIFILGILRGEPIGEMLLVSIAVAVAAVPSGLPAAVTIVLAIGMEAILGRGGLVRSLLAAETLGSTTVVLTDKTGTLTESRMQLSGLYTLSSIKQGVTDATGDNRELLHMAVLSSDAFIEEGTDESGNAVIHGRPIEKAIMLAGISAGVGGTGSDCERLDLLQFKSSRRFAVSLNRCRKESVNALYYSGAPEALLEKSTYILDNGKRRALGESDEALCTKLLDTLTAKGLRVIGIAYRHVELESIPETFKEDESKELTQKLTFAGFLAFSDPVRPDVAESIEKVRGAGARVIMVTGDNPGTAKQIAIEAGIATEKDSVCRGSDIDEMSDAELLERLNNAVIFARVLPEQKLRIAHVLRDAGDIVAMTGDGVNDAPALRSAHIGIAVGSGTDVAKESADLVLIENSFSVITDAIAEGRRIIDNLRKIVAYLLSTSFSEIVIIGGALIAAVPLPFLPVQILWANIIEEGLMSFAFAFEPRGKDVMTRDPHALKARAVLSKDVKKLIFIITGITGGALLLLYWLLLRMNLPIDEIRTIMFAALSLDSIFFAFSFKNLRQPIWHIPLFSNRYLLASLAISSALLVAALTLPPLRALLSLTPLTFGEIALLAGIGISNLALIEVLKYVFFEQRARR